MVILNWKLSVGRTVRSQDRAWVEGLTDESNVNLYILIWNLSLLWKEILFIEIYNFFFILILYLKLLSSSIQI